MTAYLPILGALLAIAAAADVGQRRVPNVVVAPLALAGLGAQGVTGGLASAGGGLLGGCAVLLVLLLPWARGMVGGGDVKLAAAVGIWLGVGSVLPFLLYTGIAGVPVALATRLSHRLALWRVARSVGGEGLEGVDPPRETVPMAVAVAAGALAALWGTP